MSLEQALIDHTAALKELTAALKNTATAASIYVAAAAPAAETKAEKPEVKETKAAEKPAKVEKPAKAKADAKPEHPTVEELVGAFTPFLAKDHPTIAENKAFVKTILAKFGAEKVSAIKDTDRKQALDWLAARIEDEDFEIDGDDDSQI